MKLTDFSKMLFAPWLRELHEAFNTTIDIQWQQRGTAFLGLFSVNDIPYVVQLSTPIVPPVAGKKVAEVSFWLHNEQDTKQSFSTSKEHTTAPTTVYGVVLNAVLEKANNFDGFYFTAEAQHSTDEELEKKRRIYLTIAKQVAKKLSGTVYTYQGKHALEVLWMSSPLEYRGKWSRPEDSLPMSK